MHQHHRTGGSLLAVLFSFSNLACGTEGAWVSLFDGRTLAGWTKAGSRDSKWEVVGGSIIGAGHASMLYSARTYKNFRFRAELKINDHGNFEVYFRCPVLDGEFGKGYEAQVNSTHADPIRTGSLYTYVHIYEQLVPPDSWFTYEIKVVAREYRGTEVPHITIGLNGQQLYQFIDHGNRWKEGHFAFQQHDPDSRVEIRKVEVLELP